MSERVDIAAPPSSGRGLLEHIDVDSEWAGGAQHHDVVNERDQRRADLATEVVQCLMEIVGRRFRLGVRPEPFGYHIAVQPMPRG